MKIRNRIRSMSLRSKILATGLIAAALIGLPIATQAGFFPGRPTFDYNKSGNGNCDDPNNPATQNGRCGSMNGPVFNSFINTPYYGDERAFTDGYRTDQGDPSTADTVKDVTEGSKQVTIRVYVHNNANQDTNCFREHLTPTGCSQIDENAVGIAKNAKVSIELPKVSGSALQAVGAISASNATPREVTDTVYMTASRAFHVSYAQGSAKLLRGTQVYKLDDSIVNGGAPIGDKVMNGILPGCFDQAAFVEITVNIIPEGSTELQVLKQVKNVGDSSGWHKEVSSKPGQVEQWLLTTKNVGLDQLTNAQVRDILPPHLSLVPGSVQIVNSDQKSYPQEDAPLFGNGLGLGTYPSGGGRYVLFKTKALDDFDGCSIRVRNIAKAKSTETPSEVQDSADVVITKENCNPPKTPTYSCDLLQVVPGEKRTATFTVQATANNGAQVKFYSFNFGDGTPVLSTDKTSVTHTYAKDGQYATQVTVTFLVNGKQHTVGGDKCAAAVTFSSTTPPTVTPPAGKGPTTLVNTGPGEVVGVVAAVSAASMLAYRWMLTRRFGSL